MSNKLALCALLLVAFVFSASLSVEAQKRKMVSPTNILLEPTTDTIEPEANEAADIDQCHNGAVNDLPAVEDCVGAQWVNGNANGNQAHYREGDYIHYRIKFTNLKTDGTTYTVKLGYDIFDNNGRHAIDYLGTYNKDNRNAQPSPGLADYLVEPCLAGTNCAGTFTSQIGVPADPDLTGVIFQEPGVFTMWGGNFAVNGASAYGLENTVIRTISLTFTPTVSNPVLSWGGHIAASLDWGTNVATAGDINGSPYHMHILKNTDFAGQQDRQTSVSAIVSVGPSAAPAVVAGRVVDRYGRGIYNARVQLFDATDGTAKEARSNSFGYYRFDDMNVGDFYVMSVSHLRYKFVNGSISFSLDQDMFDMNFVAN